MYPPHAKISKAGQMMFLQRDRLQLAMSLAWSVIELYGNLLRSQWRAHDVLFAQGTYNQIMSPYLRWDIQGKLSTTHLCRQAHIPALIRNEILFSLGLVLVELSLCQTMDGLYAPEDDDPVEAIVHLTTTTTRHFPEVKRESSSKYGQVVNQCLFWQGGRDLTLESHQMQEDIFQRIIVPLAENLRAFQTP